jgi:solute carrier family 35 (UDP-galactose transporter), member B1
MYFSYESLKFLTYPTQLIGKSCKLIPVMFLGYIAKKESYGLREVVYVVMITIGKLAPILVPLSLFVYLIE